MNKESALAMALTCACACACVLPAGRLTAKPATARSAGSAWRITSRGAGPIRFGMTVMQAKQAMRNAKFARSTDGDGAALIAVSQAGKELLSLHTGEDDPARPINYRKKISYIEVRDRRYRTDTGISPGMRLAAVEQKLGPVRVVDWSEIESREYVTFARQPKGMSFRVMSPDGSVGVYPKDTGPPAKSKKYTPGSTIFSIILTGPR